MRFQISWARLATVAILYAVNTGTGSAQEVPAFKQHDPTAIDTSNARNAQAHMEDADTALALSADGALLYGAQPLKMDGYQYCTQAVALSEKGELRQSVRAASQALYIAQQSKDENLLARAYRDLAIVYSYGGNGEKAHAFAEETLKHPAKNAAQVTSPAHKVIGDVAARANDYTKAVAEYRLALDSSSATYRPLVQISLANALMESGNPTEARQQLDQVQPGDNAVLATQLQRTQARLLLLENKPAEARKIYEQLAANSSGDDAAYFRFWAQVGIGRSELAMGDSKGGMQALGSALNGLDAVRSRFRSDEFRMGLFSDVQNVFEQAIDLYSQAGDSAQAFDLSERSRGRALLDEVRDRAKLDASAASTVPLATVQQQLHADERVIEFHALPQRLLVWVIGHDDVREQSYPIPRADLIKLVDAFRNGIIAGKRSAVGAADQLGELLIKPLDLPAGSRLVIVPHGPLHYLPFQALRVDGHYLIEQHPLSVAPSISIAIQLEQRAQHVDGKLMAFGNPEVGPEYALPAAETEVKSLAGSFPGAQVYLRSAATKTRFEEIAGRSPLIHIAAHAQADTIDPLYSRILLATETSSHNAGAVDPAKLSFLEAHEVLGLNLSKVALVTLSACDSGLGRVTDGDEVLGFTRSFLSAGTSSMIVSLWPVNDDSGNLLMSTLYAELAKGTDLQLAMQRAQLAVLAHPDTQHPFFWAPFNVIGDWRLTVGNK